jgi:hypothetical protein
MSRDRWMALLFAAGSVCFLVGPLPGYAQLVGAGADGVTFFVGSILFTAGGLLQASLSLRTRKEPGGGRSAWWAALTQFAGTLFFNVTTFRAMDVALSNADYTRLVWRPDAFGSICFLGSGLIAYRAAPRRHWMPVRGDRGWWQPAVNLLGCVLFGISAVAGYVVPASGSELDLAAANWTTCLGAACFLACAVATLRIGPDQPALDAAVTSRRPSPPSLVAGTGSLSRDEPPQRTAASCTASAAPAATSIAAIAPPGGTAPANRSTSSGSSSAS